MNIVGKARHACGRTGIALPGVAFIVPLVIVGLVLVGVGSASALSISFLEPISPTANIVVVTDIVGATISATPESASLAFTITLPPNANFQSVSLRTALTEPGVPSSSGVSDLITLTASQGGNNVVTVTASFVSDPTTEVLLPPGTPTPIFITETGAVQPIFVVSIGGVADLTVSAQSEVPEPSTAVLFAFASIGTAGALWRRYRCS
jgi:hypothetical protein